MLLQGRDTESTSFLPDCQPILSNANRFCAAFTAQANAGRLACTTSSFAAARSSTAPARPAFSGDVAIAGGRIAAVGGKQGPAKREIDADGLLVTPGWVDVHTHYDGQAMWDPLLAPSCWHGVTTVMFGNCGVGFAPVKKQHRGALMDLMEGVEEIPNPVLAAGLTWEWETFPRIHGRARPPRARHRHRGAGRASADARLCDGRSRDPARDGDRRRHRADARLTVEALQVRRLRLHHLAHRFAQDAGRRTGAVARCRRSRAARHRLGAGRDRHRCVRHEQRLRRRGVRAALDAQAGQGNRPSGLVPAHRPLRGPAALAPPDEGRACGARRRAAADGADGGPADRRDDGHRHRAQSVHGAADLQGARTACRSRSSAGGCAIPSCGGKSSPRSRPKPKSRSSRSSASSSPRRFDKFFTMGNPPDYEPGPEKSVAAIAARTGPYARRSRLRLHRSRTASISTSRW